ncbi:putative RNA-directed DNA polymerase [Cucumis melo var. makuwa]|uniref:Putative RNA-directed DNA polymerase n=1 Tax=Cucumis melo var. makuwa TaxID=1194695 RepID=A0A5D3BKR5_CUCMM|nr:putative RNA-directed DNA polymerase [Cucumis melo var. makuwa]
MVEEEDKVLGPHQELVEVINLGSQEESKEDMSGLNMDIIVHHVPLKPECNLVKQKLLSKKDEKVRMCVDYRDLNRNIIKSKWLKKIEKKTTFIILWETFYYKVMPFGLKNVGATYQRVMVTLFYDMIHKEIEVYVDDMIAKSKADEDHTTTFQKLFDRLRKYQLKLNPSKYTFGATSGKLLRLIFSEEGIKVDPDKVRAIMEMSSPKTEKEIRGQHDLPGKKEHVIYHLSKKFTDYESRYSMLERTCVLGSALANHLAVQSVVDYEPMRVDFPDENIFLVEKDGTDHGTWIMLFNGASYELGHGI